MWYFTFIMWIKQSNSHLFIDDVHLKFGPMQPILGHSKKCALCEALVSLFTSTIFFSQLRLILCLVGFRLTCSPSRKDITITWFLFFIIYASTSRCSSKYLMPLPSSEVFAYLQIGISQTEQHHAVCLHIVWPLFLRYFLQKKNRIACYANFPTNLKLLSYMWYGFRTIILCFF